MYCYIPNTSNLQLFNAMDDMERFYLAEQATDNNRGDSPQECLKEFHAWLAGKEK